MATPVDQQVTDRFMTVYQVTEMTGYSRRTLLRMIQHNQFPEPIRLNARRNVWRESRILAWMDEVEANATTTAQEQAGHLNNVSAA